MANRPSKWTKAWTHPLGAVHYVLFLIFGLLARVTRRDERRWLLPVVLGAAGVALLSGLGLAYQQVERQEHASDAAVAPSPGQRSPAPTPPTTRQVTSVKCSPPIRLQGSEADFLEAIQRHRDLDKDNPAAYKFCVAATLHNLAGFYRARQRFKESEAAYQEALHLGRELAKDNPAACQFCVAATLNNLADLYCTTQRFKESEVAYQEALHLYRDLAKDDPAYRIEVATTLYNLATLFNDMQRLKESEAAYQEALRRYRELPNPAAYQPDVARTLYGLAYLYSDMQRLQESEAAYQEALQLYRELAKSNSARYQPNVDAIVTALATLAKIKTGETEPK